MNNMGSSCVKCGNPLDEENWQCDICGALVLPPDASYVARHPLLRRLQEAGVALITLILGLGLGAAIIIGIQLNKAPASAQTTNNNGTPTATPLFVPAIISTDQPRGTLVPTDPKYANRDLLGQATRAMATLHSYEASGSFSDGDTRYSLTASALPPDRVSLIIGPGGAMPGPQQRIIFAGFNIYSSGDGGKTWQQSSSSTGTAMRIALASLWNGFDAKAITDPSAVKLIGDEAVGNSATTHLSTDFATIAKAHSLLLAAGDLSGYKGTVDVWVSKDDHTIRRLKADISGSSKYAVDITFNNFNGDIKIEQPTPLCRKTVRLR